jgi:hypothetical protein
VSNNEADFKVVSYKEFTLFFCFLTFKVLCILIDSLSLVTEDVFFCKALQVAAARALSILCFTAYRVQPQLMENCTFIIDGSEVSS